MVPMHLNKGTNTPCSFKLRRWSIFFPFSEHDSVCWNAVCSLQNGGHTKESNSYVPL